MLLEVDAKVCPEIHLITFIFFYDLVQLLYIEIHMKASFQVEIPSAAGSLSSSLRTPANGPQTAEQLIRIQTTFYNRLV